MNKRQGEGFTLIELLVVIAIIGILATMVISSLSVARQRAQTARAKSDLVQMRTLIVGAQVGENKTVREMTGASSPGTYASCPTGTDLSSLASTHACVQDWRDAIDTIAVSFGAEDGEVFYEDAWGSPYLLNEGEGEPPTPCASFDTVTSAGPNHIFDLSDDVTIAIPFESCS